jgi:hypothetical protein
LARGVLAIGITALAAAGVAAAAALAAPAASVASAPASAALPRIVVRPGAIRLPGKARSTPLTTAQCEAADDIACYLPGQIRTAYHLPAL